MMAYFLLILSTLTWATPMPGSWSSAFRVIDLHEFYPEKKLIVEPRESWQHLFSILILNENFDEQKECVYYFVPGESPGKIKVKTIGKGESCSDHLLKPGDVEWDDVTGLQYNLLKGGLKLSFTQKKNDLVNWEILTPGFTSPDAVIHLSSVETKAPRFILLAEAKESKKEKKSSLSKDQLCHGINDDCEETSESLCHLCESGWYEIPNGCAKGPKYCGRMDCGEKNRPACRRGRDYQRTEKSFDCRMDNSFAYCRKGLTIQCEGQKAYCR